MSNEENGKANDENEMENEMENGFDEIDEMEADFETITMTDEDGEEREFVVIDSFEEKGVNYMLVVAADEMDDEESEAYVLKEVSSEGEDAVFEFIDDDAEFDRIVGLFQNDNEDYDLETDTDND